MGMEKLAELPVKLRTALSHWWRSVVTDGEHQKYDNELEHAAKVKYPTDAGRRSTALIALTLDS
jgi:hypothetical protein